jgi:uncharacterized protein (TIGR03118 family)
VPGADPAKPTGQVFNPTPDFKGDLFIFATEQGTIAGWKPADGTTTVTGADRSAAGAIYKGLALGSNAQGNFLYAANFHAGTVDVFDKNYALVTLAGNFTDPKAPAGYDPFNIKNIGGRLYVAFAKQDQNQEDEIQGAGFGFVSIFDTNGKFLKRFVSGTDAGGKLSVLNAPWGIARAPSGFGPFGGDILVGNFGSGHVAAFNSKGKYLGTLRNTSNHTITIDGLWEIVFGKGGTGSSKKLYFTAGPEDETHGLFGSLESTKKKH